MVHVSGFLSSRLKVARLGFILSDLVKNVNPTVLVGYILLPFLNKTAVRIERQRSIWSANRPLPTKCYALHEWLQ
jgi:hypothetical protein